MPGRSRSQLVYGPRTIILGGTVMTFCIMVVAQGIVGFRYLRDCPRNPFIPIYVLYFVTVLIYFVVFTYCDCCNLYCYTVWTAFLFCWFITGSVAVYSIYEPNYDKSTTDSDPHCNKILYLCVFWCSNLTYVLLVVVLATLFSYCCYKEQEAGGDNNQPVLPR